VHLSYCDDRESQLQTYLESCQCAVIVQETPGCEHDRPLTMRLLEDQSGNSPCTSLACSNDQMPASILHEPLCMVAPVPAMHSPTEPISPRSPTTAVLNSATHQEPTEHMASSPSTPVPQAVHHKLRFSWESPPAAPVCARQIPRLAADESENIPILRFSDPVSESHLQNESPLLDRSARQNGEVGTRELNSMHSSRDGFPRDSDAADTQVLPPVLGSQHSVQEPLQILTAERRYAALGNGGASHEEGIVS
jgi:hypothetical protein